MANSRIVFDTNGIVEHVMTISVVTDCTDPDDNRFLELAIDGQASIIVTGDAQLLVLDGWRKIRILKNAAFIREFG